MSKPRFVVQSVSGFSDTPGAHTPHTVWSVHDRLYNYKQVANFFGRAHAEQLARARAERLNRKYK